MRKYHARFLVRGLGDRKVAWLLGRNAKEPICRKRCGVLALFAFSGMNNVALHCVQYKKSLGSRAGVFTTAFPA